MTKLSRPVRVVHVSCVHPATDSRIFEKECTSLAAAGYDVTLVATGSPPAEPGRVRVITRERYKRRLVRFILGPMWAMWQALRLRPDVIHVHDPELLPLCLLLSIFHRRIIYDAHEDLVEQLQHKHYLTTSTKKFLGVAVHGLLRLSDLALGGFVGATPHIAERFNSKWVAVVQNFPILESFPVSVGSASPRLVYVGGISRPRGLQEMIDVAHRLRPLGVTLELAGPTDGDANEILESATRSEHIIYHGVLDREGVAKLLSRSTIGLALLHPVPNYVNGQPTKLYEYMAAGIPSVASDFPLWREMVLEPRVGLVVDPLDPVAIATAIEQLLADRDEARAMGQRGREWVESHRNWESEARSLTSLYRELTTQ